MNSVRRKNDTFAQAAVGVFMTLVVLLLGYFTIVISGVNVLVSRDRVTAEFLFDSVGGLKSHDSVMYRGTKVGSVEDVEVTASNLIVRVEIDSGVVLRESCRASVCNLSMLGGNYLLLEEGEGDVIEIDASRIKGETPNDWMRDVSEIAKNLKAVTAMSEIKSIVTNLEAAVVKARSFAENADTIVARLERGEGTVGKLLSKDDKVYRYLEKTLSAAAEISGRLERGEGTIGKLLTKEGDIHGDLKEAIAAFKKSSESFDVTQLKSDARTLVLNADKLMVDAGVLVSNLTVVAERLREGEGTLGRLSKDASLYDEANGLVRDIRQVVDNYRDTTPITTFASLIGGAL
jgi:phospholipid/cholesterol/gamma-HCH transport system substrate-binding protein